MLAMTMALMMGAAPAPDPEMVCFVTMAVKAGQAADAGEKSASYDNAGGYFLATVAKRYPTPAQFGPAMKQALDSLGSAGLDASADKCMAMVQPALTLASDSIAAINK